MGGIAKIFTILRCAFMANYITSRLSLASLLCSGAGLLFGPSAALAQCGSTGCSSPSPQVGLAAITRPTAAQAVTLQARVAALEARMTRMISANSPSGTPVPGGNSSAKSASKAYLASMNARTWINGEGLWHMSPSGVTCQLSSGGSTLNSSPCSGSF